VADINTLHFGPLGPRSFWSNIKVLLLAALFKFSLQFPSKASQSRPKHERSSDSDKIGPVSATAHIISINNQLQAQTAGAELILEELSPNSNNFLSSRKGS
jgi:hypothetical protein